MSLGEDERTVVEERRGRLLLLVQETMEHLRSVEKESQDKVKALDRAVGELRLTDLFKGLVREHGQSLEVIEYLNDLKEYSLSNLNVFTAEATQPQAPLVQGAPLPSTTQRNTPVTLRCQRAGGQLGHAGRSDHHRVQPHLGKPFRQDGTARLHGGPITAIIQC